MPQKNKNIAGVHAEFPLQEWLSKNNITDVEVLVSDFAGISRGKIMPSGKFLAGIETSGHRVPNSLFGLTINCGFSHNDYITEQEEDYFLVPVLDTLRVVPWHETPTACVICEVIKEDGDMAGVAPRQVLQRVLNYYAECDWQPIVAPEFEFFLVDRQERIESPPIPPRGRSGKVAWDTGELSIDGLEEFNHILTDIQKYCTVMNVQVDTLTHEAGPAQFEFNITHGDPLSIADQSFMFKRIVKQTAIQHGIFASFMAKPYPDQYGSAMHIHQSVINRKTQKNILANEDGSNSELFLSYIAGLQKYLPAMIPFFAPYANSYLRICDHINAPVNMHWGRENRSVGLRVPTSSIESRRVENRIAGADVNSYLATAATLLAGYLGMKENLVPTDPLEGSAYDLDTQRLPQHILIGLENLEKCDVVREHMGEDFVATYLAVKHQEYKANINSLSPWEIRYLLLNV